MYIITCKHVKLYKWLSWVDTCAIAIRVNHLALFICNVYQAQGSFFIDNKNYVMWAAWDKVAFYVRRNDVNLCVLSSIQYEIVSDYHTLMVITINKIFPHIIKHKGSLTIHQHFNAQYRQTFSIWHFVSRVQKSYKWINLHVC